MGLLIDKIYWKIIWILTGLLFGIAGSLMIISGAFCADRFYDAGKVYDVEENGRKSCWNDTIHYDETTQVLVVDTDTAVKNVYLFDKTGGWHDLCIRLSAMNGGELLTRLEFYDVNDAVTGSIDTVLAEGDNYIKTPADQFYRMDIVIEGQAGAAFRIDKLQFREKESLFSKSKFITYLLPLWAGFMLLTGILSICFKKRFRKIPWYAPVEGLQKLFMYAGGNGEILHQRYSQKQKAQIRSGLFCNIFLITQIFFIFQRYTNKGYRYLALICVVLLIRTALLCWEKKLHMLNWNNKLVTSWFLLWIISMLSDLIVEKRFAYMGYLMIFVMGFLFFMWGNMEHREWLLKDFIRGIRWSFLPNLLFCWLFRPVLPGYRYMGSWYSPGIFGLYILFVWIAFLAEMKFDYTEKPNIKHDLFYVCMLGICANMLWKTQSITSLLAAALAALIFSLKLWINRKKIRFFGIPMLLLVFFIGFTVNNYSIYHIPRMLHTEIKFSNDFYMDTATDHPFLLNVSAAEPGNNNRILYKLKTSVSLETLTSGRTLYWKAYLRDMNLFGHYYNATFWGSGHKPHNGYITIMYRYGIFALVPYVMMILYNLIYAVRYFWENMYDDRKYAFFILADMLCCIWLLVMENLELPFGWICWYGMYLIMGVYFDGGKKEN